MSEVSSVEAPMEVIGDLTAERDGYDNLVIRLAGVVIGEYAVENSSIGNSERTELRIKVLHLSAAGGECFGSGGWCLV